MRTWVGHLSVLVVIALMSVAEYLLPISTGVWVVGVVVAYFIGQSVGYREASQ
jgi:energy-converting hydrogenase Eha subunit B